MPETVLQINNLCVGYKTKKNNRNVIENISANMQKGKLTCLLGKNGSGKSTLLKTISGLIPSTSGEIIWKGRKLETFKPRELPQLLTLVLTDNSGFGQLNVMELLESGRYPYTDWLGKITETDKKAINKAIEKAGIENLISKLFLELSDGEKQKVMIARCLAQDTPVFILDEPVAHLDIIGRAEILKMLRRYALQENKAVLFSTHELDIALRLADDVWLIHDKKILTGAPEDLIFKGDLKTAFQSNEIDIHNGSVELKFVEENRAEIILKCPEEMKKLAIRGLSRYGIGVSESSSVSLEIFVQADRVEWKLIYQERTFAGYGFSALWALLNRSNGSIDFFC